MTWRVLVKPIDTTDAAPSVPTVYQSMTMNASAPNKLLGHAVAGIYLHNPTFTAMTMKIWADQGGSPSKLIATSSNSKARSDLLRTSDNYGVCWAKFNFGGLPLKAGSKYHFSLHITGYTYGSTSFLGWRHSYPDPQYRSGLTLNAVKAAMCPLDLVLLTAAL